MSDANRGVVKRAERYLTREAFEVGLKPSTLLEYRRASVVKLLRAEREQCIRTIRAAAGRADWPGDAVAFLVKAIRGR